MTVVARRIIAVPVRTASDAWAAIVNLLAPGPNSKARSELLHIAGVASALIADEAMKAPIVVYGSGPRVRIYCLYDEDAITGEAAREETLAFNATEGDWRMSLPCPADDLAWVQDALQKRSSHVTARDMTTTVDAEKSEGDGTVSTDITDIVDTEAFFRS